MQFYRREYDKMMWVIVIKLGIKFSLYKVLYFIAALYKNHDNSLYAFVNFFLNVYVFFEPVHLNPGFRDLVDFTHLTEFMGCVLIMSSGSPPKLFGVYRIPNEIYPLNEQKLATVIDIYSRVHLLYRISFPENVNLYPASKTL